ncbi:MAG: trehalose-phosphatase [Deltaproteobacteria bacterium]|nr:trehalose-phosphatase [Deltaproteobacteria bacterium]
MDRLTSASLDWQRLIKKGLLWVFDYDGTLVPIIRNPYKSQMRPRFFRFMQKFVRKYPAAVLSGRELKNIASRVKGLSFRYVVGNHGSEWKTKKMRAGRFARATERARKIWEQIPHTQGIELENKKLSLTIHYRNCADPSLILRKLPSLFSDGYRLVGGKKCLNILPADAPSKGDAVRRMRKLSGLSRVIYFGDDETDEDVFGLESWLIGVRIGPIKRSQARYTLQNSIELEKLLRAVVSKDC